MTIVLRRRERVRVMLLLIVSLLLFGHWRRGRGGVVIPSVPGVPHAAVVSLLLSVGHVHSPLGHLQSEKQSVETREVL